MFLFLAIMCFFVAVVLSLIGIFLFDNKNNVTFIFTIIALCFALLAAILYFCFMVTN